MAELKSALICRDGWLRTWISPHGGTHFGKWWERTPKTKWRGEHPMITLGYAGKVGDYSLEGRSYRYYYRLMRSFFMAEHTGSLMFWIEGDPTPIDFRDEKWKSALKNAAYMVHDIAETDAPDRLLKPRPIAWGIIIVVGLLGLFAGLAVGQMLGK